ncbi:MAG: hypothetical protein ABIG11_04590 [bacterium]
MSALREKRKPAWPFIVFFLSAAGGVSSFFALQNSPGGPDAANNSLYARSFGSRQPLPEGFDGVDDDGENAAEKEEAGPDPLTDPKAYHDDTGTLEAFKGDAGGISSSEPVPAIPIPRAKVAESDRNSSQKKPFSFSLGLGGMDSASGGAGRNSGGYIPFSGGDYGAESASGADRTGGNDGAKDVKRTALRALSKSADRAGSAELADAAAIAKNRWDAAYSEGSGGRGGSGRAYDSLARLGSLSKKAGDLKMQRYGTLDTQEPAVPKSDKGASGDSPASGNSAGAGAMKATDDMPRSILGNMMPMMMMSMLNRSSPQRTAAAQNVQVIEKSPQVEQDSWARMEKEYCGKPGNICNDDKTMTGCRSDMYTQQQCCPGSLANPCMSESESALKQGCAAGDPECIGLLGGNNNY